MKSEISLFNPQGKPLSVLILVFDETNALSLSSVVDPMRAANRRAGKKLFDWKFATPSGALANLTAGIAINAPALFRSPSADLLISRRQLQRPTANFATADHPIAQPHPPRPRHCRC